MGIPFEALLPYGIIVGMFCVTGVGLSTVKFYHNGGKWPRHNTDRWDRQMQERDRRLTGFFRGQSDKPMAPKGFEMSAGWKVEPRLW